MMQDDIQSVLISEQQLADAVKKLGEQISRDYADRNLMMVSVLKGSVVFMDHILHGDIAPGRRGGDHQRSRLDRFYVGDQLWKRRQNERRGENYQRP